MYIETSLPRSYGDEAKLLFSPSRSAIGKWSCLKFYYHMYGATINRLDVFNGNSMVFTQSGQQGDTWLYAETTVILHNIITFEGIRGSSYTGDIAIDDVSLMDGFCTGCKHTLNDSFGHLNITYNEKFSPDCIWTILNFGISEPVAIVSIEKVQFGYCSGFIKVLDGNGTQVFTQEGCQTNHTSHTFHEIAFEETQNITIQVALKNYQSYVRASYCVLENGLDAASPLPGWNFTLGNKTSHSLNLEWMDINLRLNSGVRFFVVIARSSSGNVPVKKIFSADITSVQITELDPSTEYNVSVVAIDGHGSPFKTAALLARTDEGDCGSVHNNTLRSPGYPSPYPNKMDCVYRVPIPFDEDLLILFDYFSLEDKSNCTSDYLRISDGRDRIVGTYCGYQTGKSLRVVGRTAVLKFVSNQVVRYHGFSLSFIFTPKGCGFENGLCPGWHQSYTDDFDWTRHSGHTWSFLTGPSSGHGGYGFYMYIETSSPRSYGDKAKLLFSPPSSVIGTISCLKFYYHMYGATINRLNVFNGYSTVFTKSGQQGNRWRYAEVTVFVQSTITFEGVRGSSYTGDIAIDDVSLMDGICRGCMEALNDSFGYLNITYNEKFSPACIWALGNSGISEPVAIVSIEKVQLGFCSGYIKVLDGSGVQVFSRDGCLNNHTSSMFLEIAFRETQNVTIQVSLNNNQSCARVAFGISKDGLDAASPLAGWNVILENKTSKTLQLRWMEINHRLNGGLRFFAVIAKSSYSSAPVRKIISPNITSAEITELDPYTVYNVSVVAIDGNGLPFHSSVLQASTDESVPKNAPSALIVTNITATSLTVKWTPLPQHYHNGRLLGYRVYFRKTAKYPFPVVASSVAVYNSSWVTLNNLQPGQRYEIYVTGFTSKGNGPRSYGYFVITACSLSVNHSLGLIDVAPSADNNPLNCSWTIGNVGIANAVATFIIERINISSCREHFKIADGTMTSKYDRRGRSRSAHEQIVVVPFLSSAEINVGISLIQQGSSVKAKYMVLRSALYSAPVLPGWNLTISNETSLSFSVQWTNLTALLGSQVEHFIVLLKSNRNNNSNVFHKIVNGRERRTEMTGLLSSSQYTVEVFGTDKMGHPYRTLEARARTMNEICGKRPTRSTLIVGGTVAPINSWPWQVLLRTRDGRQFCGGSLIKPEWVLTATHCVEGKSPSSIQVTLGAHYLSTASVVGTEQQVDVAQIIQHKNYNSPKRWSNDVALLKLSRPAVLRNGVGLVCLSDDQFQRPFNGRSCWTTGWGRLSWPGPQPKELMQVDLPLVSPQNCSTSYPTGYDQNSMICAGTSQGGTGACKGDSGGPLVCEFKGKWYLEGVTSWGRLPCALPSKPTVYADVRKLKSWIIRKMNDGLVSTCSSVINNTLKSPGYPSYYPRNKVCVYQVPIPCNKELIIYFNYFHLESSLINCRYDYLRITDGSNRVIGTFCGRQTGRSVLVNDTIAVLTFKTDGSVQFIGFHLSFSFFPRGAATLPPFVSPTPITTQRPTTTASPGCGSSQNNSLRSPGYPSNYPNNMHCIYRVPIPFDQYLLVYFTYFSVESHLSCSYDYLRITDGSTYYTIGTYCGYQTGKRVRVDGSVAVLTFHSDGSVQRGGFYLSFSFFPQPRGCDFENGLCPGWYQSYTDDFDWTRLSGPTGSYMTGPSTGHGGYGFYIYIEASSPRLYGDRARLRFSPPSSATGKLSCLKFYYHMYGATINQLNVFNGSTIAFTKFGQQGNRWLFAEVTVFVRNTITFEGIRGSSFTGDIAIDDVSLVDGVCTGCIEALNDSFGQLNITFNETFSPDCKWIIPNAEISQAIAIVSIEEAHLSYCSGYIKVLDGNSTQIFSREGCLSNHTSSVFLEIAIQESQNVTVRVSLNNNQSYVRLSYGILKDGLHAASPLAGWSVTLENKTSSSLQLRWMDINHRLNGGVRFFVVIAKSSYSSVPVRKLFSPNITPAEITGLDPHTVYNVSVVAIDGYGSSFRSTVLQAKTNGWSCGFEDGLCRGWYQSYNDDFDWTRRLGPTWPYNTGPSSGHGGYGFYMYIETWPRSYGDKAKLLFSPPNSVIGAMSCLKFYYHMYGATINRLNVFNGNSIVFTRSGQQGNRWLYTEVTIFVKNTITFEGIVGSSYTGNIAIDDVSLMDGACTVCGFVQNNTLRSPYYPGLYPSNLFCVYRINIPRGKDLNIHFNYFSLEYHSNCT
ncbi:PREDICTED: uncharacterized protein LOC107352362 [Acropora digitifera]|uniref:uncharacterized protein LOC107352362 n=1 Tax=Acropora digitifera TaxID=70779 RepID=UPI00077A1FD5|nr:PREDICTED: uncharacterized protein LOC107352362 [Acropora digitifera]